MKSKILETLRDADIDILEFQVAVQCGPVLAGLRISALLTLCDGQCLGAMCLFRRLEIPFYILCRTDDMVTFLVYRGGELVRYLQEPTVKSMLEYLGYPSLRLGDALPELASRYVEYLKKKENFPHEMGLFLGYPPEDVEGFIKNNGQKFQYIGYWKVYTQAEEKKRLFSRYDAVTCELLSVLAEGETLWECLRDGIWAKKYY